MRSVSAMWQQATLEENARELLTLGRELYDRIGSMTQGRELVDSFTIPIRSGRAWEVPAGHVCRIVTIEGPQVADLNLWNLHDPRERLWASRTRQLQAAHVSLHDRLWSTLPFLRPLVTITGDSLADYGVDDEGGRVHDLLGTHQQQDKHDQQDGSEGHDDLLMVLLELRQTGLSAMEEP